MSWFGANWWKNNWFANWWFGGATASIPIEVIPIIGTIPAYDIRGDVTLPTIGGTILTFDIRGDITED